MNTTKTVSNLPASALIRRLAVMADCDRLLGDLMARGELDRPDTDVQYEAMRDELRVLLDSVGSSKDRPADAAMRLMPDDPFMTAIADDLSLVAATVCESLASSPENPDPRVTTLHVAWSDGLDVPSVMLEFVRNSSAS